MQCCLALALRWLQERQLPLPTRAVAPARRAPGSSRGSLARLPQEWRRRPLPLCLRASGCHQEEPRDNCVQAREADQHRPHQSSSNRRLHRRPPLRRTRTRRHLRAQGKPLALRPCLWPWVVSASSSAVSPSPTGSKPRSARRWRVAKLQGRRVRTTRTTESAERHLLGSVLAVTICHQSVSLASFPLFPARGTTDREPFGGLAQGCGVTPPPQTLEL